MPTVGVVSAVASCAMGSHGAAASGAERAGGAAIGIAAGMTSGGASAAYRGQPRQPARLEFRDARESPSAEPGAQLSCGLGLRVLATSGSPCVDSGLMILADGRRPISPVLALARGHPPARRGFSGRGGVRFARAGRVGGLAACVGEGRERRVAFFDHGCLEKGSGLQPGKGFVGNVEVGIHVLGIDRNR